MSILDQHCTIPNAKIVGEYACTLNLVDINLNSNKFYVIQAISDGKGFHIITRYGRVGEKGVVSTKECSSKEETVKAFLAAYKSKTGVNWPSKDSKPGKYTLMVMEKPQIVDIQATAPTSVLPDKLQALLRLISNKDMITQTLQLLSVDVKKLPLGRISNEQIDKALALLEDVKNTTDTEALAKLCSQLWTLVPYATKRTQRPPVLKTEEQIKTTADMLDSLKHISVAGRLLSSDVSLDNIYTSLNTKIDPLDTNSEEYLQIEKYIKNTHAPTHHYSLKLANVYKLDKSALDCSKPGGRFLMFHGSRLSNFIGILTEGLRLPRPDQVVNGTMFGQGVYFANAISKSFNYTCASSTGGVGLVLLCEVLLGDTDHVTNSTQKCKGDTISAHGKSTPGSTEPWVVDKDVQVPNGKLVKVTAAGSLLYDEFVIYDKSRYRFRYLLHLVQN